MLKTVAKIGETEVLHCLSFANMLDEFLKRPDCLEVTEDNMVVYDRTTFDMVSGLF